MAAVVVKAADIMRDEIAQRPQRPARRAAVQHADLGACGVADGVAVVFLEALPRTYLARWA